MLQSKEINFGLFQTSQNIRIANQTKKAPPKDDPGKEASQQETINVPA